MGVLKYKIIYISFKIIQLFKQLSILCDSVGKSAFWGGFLGKSVKIKKYFGVFLETFFGKKSAKLDKCLASTTYLLLVVHYDHPIYHRIECESNKVFLRKNSPVSCSNVFKFLRISVLNVWFFTYDPFILLMPMSLIRISDTIAKGLFFSLSPISNKLQLLVLP